MLGKDREEAFRICEDYYFEFNKSNPDDGEIIYLSKELIMLSSLPKNTKFTRGEKQLLHTIGMMLQADYMMTDLEHQGVDYGAMRVHIELLEKALQNGLEDRYVTFISIDVLFNDVLKDYNVEYDNSNNGDDFEDICIYWNALSELYNSYSSYKVKYKGFDNHSLSILSSATEKYKEYQERTIEEKAILSVNGIAADFAAVVEHEFKKIIIKLSGKNRWSFFDAINEFENMSEYESPALFSLSSPEYIDRLHFVRKIHNDIDHGNRLITEEELEKLYHYIVFCDMCQLISDGYQDINTHIDNGGNNGLD